MSQTGFNLIKHYLTDMSIEISDEIPEEEIVIITDESAGIKEMILDCEEPILIIEQVIMKNPGDRHDFYKDLLKINRKLVHGAFVMDEEEKTILYRDTLQLAHINRNELEASLNSLGLAMTEFGDFFIKHAH